MRNYLNYFLLFFLSNLINYANAGLLVQPRMPVALAVTHQWVNSISNGGVTTLSQPAFTDVSGSVAAGQMPALTGDVTSSAGAVATTVAKIAGVAVGTPTGTGNVVMSAGPTLTGTITAASENLSGSLLVTGGTVAVGSVQTSTYAVLTTDNVVLLSGASGAFSATLPTAVGVTGKIYYLKRTDQTLANAVTIATTSSQTIDGVTTRHLMTQYESLVVVSDGANWQVMDHQIRPGWTAFTPAGSWTANATYTAFWRRNFDSIDLDIKVLTTATPTPTVALTIPIPTGLTINTSVQTLAAAGITPWNGSVALAQIGTNNFQGFVRYNDTSSIGVRYDTGTLGANASVTPTTPFAWINTDYAVIKVSGIPITNWEQ